MELMKDIGLLTEYGIAKGLIEPEDRNYTINRLLEVFGLSVYDPTPAPARGSEAERSDAQTDCPEVRPAPPVLRTGEGGSAATTPQASAPAGPDLAGLLDRLCDEAYSRGLIPENSVTFRDLFDTRLMGILTPRPSRVQKRFRQLYAQSPRLATDGFYRFCKDTNYIRTDRIARDLKWKVDSDYGMIDITINLSKPEKDPRAIAAARSGEQEAGRLADHSPGSFASCQDSSSSRLADCLKGSLADHSKGRPANLASPSPDGRIAYPRCQLCMENEGYAGRPDHPARQNLRIIPLELQGERWGFQYSPYVYYNEHCIILNGRHVPMKIDRGTFRKLFDFLRQFPHYFIGSNADLPIVGGSILTHDHFQGGRYTFAMERAEPEETFCVPGYEEVSAAILHWPLSVIRLRHSDPDRLTDLADHILCAWRNYTDETAGIFAETGGEPHNTITPIARRRGGDYELDLALRNNITTAERPLGLFHPRPEYHHIKKENIGLIEVMGLAVLPSRLKREMELLAECLIRGGDPAEHPSLTKHARWASELRDRYAVIGESNVRDILKEEIGRVFVGVLEDAGVFRCTEEGRRAFRRFISTL
ncbi:UDP-glucose--hexose-1-phosphate uridylyltransferase [Hornefia porci]|uniref:UDP-glucose--hexose-1-phosphate uridylyltransferase n=1 Tax=Hornefia porci TaxID=2652292 RepID=UPI000AF01FD0|nr:UDP-glucose--hexose-1-phosphate uridylyltransferase [Hornefia porci]